MGRVIVWPKYRAHAVGICQRIERPVELAAAQADARFERSPGTLDLRQLICDSHEHDVGRLTNNDVLCTHAHNVQPLTTRASGPSAAKVSPRRRSCPRPVRPRPAVQDRISDPWTTTLRSVVVALTL